MENLVELGKEVTMTSVELVEMINGFRKLEGELSGEKVATLRHDHFMAKIRKELEVLKSLGLEAQPNIWEGEYEDGNNQSRPCFSLNRDGALQMLNSESILVRAKTIEYINKLEERLNAPSYQIEDPVARAEAWIMEEKERQRLQLETREQKEEIEQLKPKADYTDKILQSDSLVTIGQIAKDYGMSAEKMNNLLHEYGIQYKQSGQWLLYSQYQGKGYTHSTTHHFSTSTGMGSSLHTKWRQRGRKSLYDFLKEKDVLPIIERSQLMEVE